MTIAGRVVCLEQSVVLGNVERAAVILVFWPGANRIYGESC